MKVIVQLRSTQAAQVASINAAAAVGLTAAPQRALSGLDIDADYPPVELPDVTTTTGAGMRALTQPLEFSLDRARSTYLVRGTLADDSAALAAAMKNPDVVGIFSDPLIESSIICPGGPALGATSDVAKLLAVKKLHANKMDGRKVFLAIVDSGINLAHLKAQGVTAKVDVPNSWTPAGVATGPGAHPLAHGTMCAYDACIAAPHATLLDCAVLLSTTPGSTVMAGLLSDAVQAYAKLRAILNAMPAAKRAMVVSNSWGMFSPTWDFPPGHPGNYSDNPNHPFNLIVSSLEAAGADILFAAGNCGVDCPDGRCAFGSTPTICGANSHPAVLSIAGVDTSKARVGYSSQGPGRLTRKKPDLAAFTHFDGSKVYLVDGGTSAACPVAAGVVAAFRTKYPVAKLSPMQMASLLKKTAQDMGGLGYDFDYGWGVVDPAALLLRLP